MGPSDSKQPDGAGRTPVQPWAVLCRTLQGAEIGSLLLPPTLPDYGDGSLDSTSEWPL
jgi:hypothetical protein